MSFFFGTVLDKKISFGPSHLVCISLSEAETWLSSLCGISTTILDLVHSSAVMDGAADAPDSTQTTSHPTGPQDLKKRKPNFTRQSTYAGVVQFHHCSARSSKDKQRPSAAALDDNAAAKQARRGALSPIFFLIVEF